MSGPLFGMETEYATSAVDARGRRLNQGLLLDALASRARTQGCCLPDEHNGIFLPNAARFYVDAGGHPELTTPECTNPWDVVRYLQAGERFLLGLANDARVPASVAFYRTNVDYSGTGTTWGCHESYLHRLDPTSMPAQLVPHLVSRIVYAGAGGFDNTSPGVAFTLSPRATHMRTEVSGDSTRNRGIFHTKDEPLCGGGRHRLHVIFGESLCSELATWLKVGTTVLVVALCDAGVRPGDAVAVRDAVGAVRTFAGDPSCTAVVPTARGPLTATAIQRHYLEVAEAHLGASFMPPWADVVCRRWREVLAQLESGWEPVATRLDWAIKLALYRDHMRRRGFPWETVDAWNRVADGLAQALGTKRISRRRLPVDLLADRSSPIAGEVAKVAPLLETLGLDWRGFRPFVEARAALFELDTRFGQLGEHGLFARLDAAGLLDHHVEGIDNIEHAVDNPPDVPRARVRGQLVRELSGSDGRYRCGWQGVWDFEEGRTVDLNDPFGAVLEWKEWCPETLERARRLAALGRVGRGEPHPITLNQAALEHRQHGEFEEAENALRRAIEIEDARVPPDSPKRAHRRNNLALVLLRAGRIDEAVRVNAEAWRLKVGTHDLTSGRILFVRIALRFLSGDGDVGFYLGQLRTLLERPSLPCLGDIDRSWTVPDVFTTLYDTLPFGRAELLLDLARAFDAHPDLSVLEELEAWHAVDAVPLDSLWPEDRPRQDHAALPGAGA